MSNQHVNYLTQHQEASKRLAKDVVSAIDISVYNALFIIWNQSGWKNSLSINRQDVMQIAKVGNKNTYTSSLQKLHEKGYIIYQPSNNPLIGSVVSITIFGKSKDKIGITNSGKGGGNSSGNTGGKGGGTLHKPIKPIKLKETLQTCNILSSAFAEVERMKGLLVSKDGEIEQLKIQLEEERKKLSAQKKKAEKEPPTEFWQAWVDEWHNYYGHLFRAKPTFGHKQGSALKQIAAKLKKRHFETDYTKELEWNQGMAVATFHQFLNVSALDSWLRSNFLLENLNSKFDSIVNGKSQSTANAGKQTGGNVNLNSAFSKIDAIYSQPVQKQQ